MRPGVEIRSISAGDAGVVREFPGSWSYTRPGGEERSMSAGSISAGDADGERGKGSRD